jgi:hypothetical protein
MTDRELARRLRRTMTAVISRRVIHGIPGYTRKEKWTRFDETLLGTMPDEELARRLRRTPTAIQVHRVAVGVGAFGSKHGGRGVNHRGPVWPPEELGLLGKLPDLEIMLRIGRSAAAVHAKRFKLGL